MNPERRADASSETSRGSLADARIHAGSRLARRSGPGFGANSPSLSATQFT